MDGYFGRAIQTGIRSEAEGCCWRSSEGPYLILHNRTLTYFAHIPVIEQKVLKVRTWLPCIRNCLRLPYNIVVRLLRSTNGSSVWCRHYTSCTIHFSLVAKPSCTSVLWTPMSKLPYCAEIAPLYVTMYSWTSLRYIVVAALLCIVHGMGANRKFDPYLHLALWK